MSEDARVMAAPTLHHSGFCAEYFVDRRGHTYDTIKKA